MPGTMAPSRPKRTDKRKQEPTPPAPHPEAPAERTSQNRSGKSLQLYIPPDLADAFDAYIEASRPKTTKTGIIVMLLEDFLRKAGTLPAEGGAK